MATDNLQLHNACNDVNCPSEEIKLLLLSNRAALETFGSTEIHLNGANISTWLQVYFGGCESRLPLHYYLARSCNRDLSVVKMLVDSYPEALLVDCLHKPIHILLANSNIEDVYIIDDSSAVLLSKTNKMLTTTLIRDDKYEITDHSIYTVKKLK